MGNSLPHKYVPGDVVGVVGDCMADCEVVRRLRKRPGKPVCYVMRAVRIHHPDPPTTFFGKNRVFQVPEGRVTAHLRSKQKGPPG